MLADMSPRQIVDLSDVLTRDEALTILEPSVAGKEERVRNLLAHGYPTYTTSAAGSAIRRPRSRIW